LDLVGHVGFLDLYESNIIRLSGLVNCPCTTLEIGSNLHTVDRTIVHFDSIVV